ncbi:hypothetical protein XFF6991_150016 [Xanthomonas phaseoli pv. phaseoli]|uniref:Uncharacterized protein n=1 Tax=Xanthomonas campestris pv. phaseoli TaxID=317013 RepID=A0A7Z7NF01_XANCH|nr:hypothetical protein XFF6991_150016 [Xanthomonas phaseoli pv. phaseoli]
MASKKNPELQISGSGFKVIKFIAINFLWSLCHFALQVKLVPSHPHDMPVVDDEPFDTGTP